MLGESLGEVIIKENLANINRSLSVYQFEVVKDCFKFCNAALYVESSSMLKVIYNRVDNQENNLRLYR